MDQSTYARSKYPVRHGTKPATGWFGTALVFGVAALLLWFATRWAIPGLMIKTSAEPILLWFVAASVCVFAPLLLAGWAMLRRERSVYGITALSVRLRFRRLSRADWSWSAGGLLLIWFSSAGTLVIVQTLYGASDLYPSFMLFEPLTGDRIWILVAWLPFFVLNIFGEEAIWRGVLLPRQEAGLGQLAWLANGVGWLFFHLPFGVPMLLMLVPTILVLPYAVQQTRNSSVGLVIHAGLNGPGFLVVAFGLI